MAGKGTISISFAIEEGKDGLKKLIVDADGLRKVMEKNVKVTERFQKEVFEVAAKATSIQAASSAVQQLNGVLQGLTSESLSFSKAMKAANTMAGKDSAGFEQLKDEVAGLAREIPIARDELANGLYQVVSNGVPEDNWISFLETSARSAVGGMADINKVVGVTSTLIKNYGLEWSAAADIQDKIQLTAKNGVTSFEQLAQALPRVTGNAATLGVSIDELMGTFATLTGVSGNTAEVSTQLAAIFTALVKPSSEAAEMAAKMGIQFDAAAIQAAGGFQNFLTQLDGSVKAYAQATGVLEQEVYGKLFGSAEAIRALIPLQGELADKFTANVANMVNSAGTMDAAFEGMGSTGEAVTQMLKNKFAVFSDLIASVTSGIQPFLDFGAGLLATAANVGLLAATYKQLNVQQTLVATRAKLASVAMVTLGLRGKSAAAVVRVFGSAMKGGAYSATALKIALRGLLIATGIGAAIAALTTVIEYFVSSTDDATESTNKFLDAEERAKREAEQLDQLRKQEASTLTNTRAALEINISKLKEFNGTKEQEKKLVSEMNDTYGDTMGYFSSVADWYNALISNSEAYCRQMVIEARTRMLANQIAEKEQETHDLIYDENGNKRKYSTARKKETVAAGEVWVNGRFGPEKQISYTEEEVVGSSDLEKANAAIKANNAAVANLRKQMQGVAEEAASINFKVKGSDYRLGLNPKPEEGVSQGLQPAWTENPEIIKEYADNIRILKEELETAKGDRVAEINKEIAKYQDAIAEIESRGTGKVWIENAQSIAQMSNNLSILREQLDNVDSDELAAGINKQIGDLESIIASRRNAGKTDETNKLILKTDASNLKDIEGNISFLTDQLQTAAIEEAALINEQIEAWGKKAEAIRNAGKEAEITFDTFRQGWDGIKGIGSGIEGITGALEGNGNAWQKITGIVDGFIQIYEGISAIVGIINMLGAATTTKSHATDKDTTSLTANTQATLLNTAAKSGDAVAEATASGAKMPFPMNLVAIAAGVAAVISALSSVGSFSNGGIVGGNSPYGDKLLARVNSGEMILNREQQQRLFKALNGMAPVPFANGGIISGPTIGLIGEYAGAANNPEVVAPLNKLRTLLKPDDSAGGGRVVFRIDGRTLVGILEKETNFKKRS